MELSSVYERIKVLEDEKVERENFRDYGDWAGSFFSTLGLKKMMSTLELEFMNHTPNHWSQPAHRSVKKIIDRYGVSESEFQVLWDYKKARNTMAHGSQSGFITVANFEDSYNHYYPKLEGMSSMPATLKAGLKKGMDVVHSLLTTQVQMNLQQSGTQGLGTGKGGYRERRNRNRRLGTTT